jgi:hypothetical protein
MVFSQVGYEDGKRWNCPQTVAAMGFTVSAVEPSDPNNRGGSMDISHVQRVAIAFAGVY